MGAHLTVKDALSEYLSRGFSVVPVPAKAKGPKIPKWHVTRFTADSFSPGDNVGLILGAASDNLVDVDLDSAAAVELADVFLPQTGMVHGRSGKPRSHRWYILEDAPQSVTQFQDPEGAMLVEIRSGSENKGAQTVVPPSVHVSGEVIEWAEFGTPARLTLADLLPGVKRLAAAAMLVRVFPSSGRHKFCMALAGVLLRSGMSVEDTRTFVRAVAAVGGSTDPDARAGVVESTAQKLAAGEQVTGVPTLIESAGGDVLGPLVSAYVTGALDLLCPRVETADGPYSGEAIEEFARACGLSVAEYLGSMIVQDGRSSTMWVRDGVSFRPPVNKQNLELAVSQWLGAYPIARSYEKRAKDGTTETVYMNPQQVAKACSVLAQRVTASFVVPMSTWDPKGFAFTERLAPQRELVPEYHAQIDAWLRLLGGKDAERLLDWISAVTRLDEQCCALYLCGSAGAGKGLLAQGLARVWTKTGPVPLKAIVGSFNDPLADCPLVFADEAIPDRSASASLRALIADSSLALNRKHLSCLQIHGSIRLLVAANNDAVLSFDEILTEEDIQALGVRFLKIDVGEEPREFLQELGGWSVTPAWVTGDRIAKHALWLVENRKPVRGKRFFIDGNAAEIGKIIRKHGKTEGLILGVVVDALEGTGANALEPPIHVDEDFGVWINATRVFRTLQETQHNFKATERDVATTASNLCEGDRKKHLFWNGLTNRAERVWCRKLDLGVLEEWAKNVRGLDDETLSESIQAFTSNVPEKLPTPPTPAHSRVGRKKASDSDT